MFPPRVRPPKRAATAAEQYGHISAPIANVARIAEIGRSKNGNMLPSDLISEVTNACSTMVFYDIIASNAAARLWSMMVHLLPSSSSGSQGHSQPPASNSPAWRSKAAAPASPAGSHAPRPRRLRLISNAARCAVSAAVQRGSSSVPIPCSHPHRTVPGVALPGCSLPGGRRVSRLDRAAHRPSCAPQSRKDGVGCEASGASERRSGDPGKRGGNCFAAREFARR